MAEVVEDRHRKLAKALSLVGVSERDSVEDQLERALGIPGFERRQHIRVVAVRTELFQRALDLRRREQLVEEGRDRGRRSRPDELGDDPCLAEALHGGDALHAVGGGEALVRVHVHLTSSTWPSRAPISRSRTGVSAWHGPHHSAQKSTTTGTSRERSTTSCSKVCSVTSVTTRSGCHRDHVGRATREEGGA